MSVSPKLEKYLNDEGAIYEHHVHPKSYTAIQTAASIHIPATEMAKTVVVRADGKLLLAVLPADRKLNLQHLKFITRAEHIGVATEAEFEGFFPSCELGAMPPFGNLFGVATYCDTLLEENGTIEFNAGSHDDSIRMEFKDFKHLSRPIMVDLVTHSRSR
jgi:Ala-tRNA(Pro) deacylase